MNTAEFERLYCRLEKPMFNVVYRWVWAESDAQDLVQEAFVRLWKMRDDVRMETVEPLVYRIAINLASNRRRFTKVRVWLGLDALTGVASKDSPADERMVRAQQHHAARAAVEALPEKLRRVVMLTELAGLTYTEVAQTLEIPEGTVASRRHAAMARLREAMVGG